MQFRPLPLIAALALAAGGAAAQSTGGKQDSQQSTGAAAPAKAANTANVQQGAKAANAQGVEKLQKSAQRLRESIQAMAQKQPGADRDRAIEKAHDALFETQRAMAALSPEARAGVSGSGAGSGSGSGASYDQSVQKLMSAADSLRDSIIAISQQPAGQARDRAVEQAQQALWDTRLALVSAYDPGSASRVMGAGAQTTGSAAANTGTGSGQSAAGQQSGKSAQQAGNAARQSGAAGATPAEGAAVLALLPVQLVSGDKLANGCWVRFYDGPNFSGTTLTLAGPVDMPSMYPAGVVWRDWESAVVGPKARVSTFDNENFRQRTATLAPGQRLPDLRDRKLGWFDEVHSARVACTS